MTVSVAAASACEKRLFSGGMPVASVAAADEGVDGLIDREQDVGAESPVMSCDLQIFM